jgi:hypothetical protein
MKVLLFDAKDVFHRTDQLGGGVVRGDDGAMLDVGPHDVDGATVRIDVIATILRVVFDDEDERAGGVGAMVVYVRPYSVCTFVQGKFCRSAPNILR